MITRRFNWHVPARWQYKPLLLPLITALLSLFLMSSKGETQQETGTGQVVIGATKDAAFVVTLFEEGPMLRFEVVFTKERR